MRYVFPEDGLLSREKTIIYLRNIYPKLSSVFADEQLQKTREALSLAILALQKLDSDAWMSPADGMPLEHEVNCRQTSGRSGQKRYTTHQQSEQVIARIAFLDGTKSDVCARTVDGQWVLPVPAQRAEVILWRPEHATRGPVYAKELPYPTATVAPATETAAHVNVSEQWLLSGESEE